MFFKRVCLISAILSIASAAPRRLSRSVMPMWHLPCGDDIDMDVTSSHNPENAMQINLENLKLQHQLTMNDYLNRDYDFLYEKVRIGVHDHQYIPNWVPGKKAVNIVKRLTNATSQTIINHFPKFHIDLQKFAVAFEELVVDESNPQIQEALRTTQSYLTMMLCEVESIIVTLPSLHIPTRVERSIMSSIERDPVDETRRLVRDWGVLLKYRDYLHAWRHVFNY